MNKVTRVIVGTAIAGFLAVGATSVASAKDGDVLAVGSCTKSTTSKIKLSPENGRIEVEFEVDQNRNGVRWSVAIRHRGQVVRRLVRVTRAPSGSFEARVVLPNGPGAHRIAATATRRGETCTAAATF
ncbi:MAG: hypothetical protein H0U82_06755 [Actinobacteria bacterium]|nr:hypothetical protein [Actinomycetota bacterium]